MTRSAHNNPAYFARPEYEAAREALGEEINQTRERLFQLQLAYEALGGTYEDEEIAAPELPKMLPPPRPSRKAAKADAVRAMMEDDGKLDAREFDIREAQVFLMLNTAMEEGSSTVRLDDICGVYGGIKTRWYQAVGAFREKLWRLHRHDLVNVRGIGYRLEKIT